MPQESLLPNTKAIQRSTAQTERYNGGVLVRFKLKDGTTWQRHFPGNAYETNEEASTFFWGVAVPSVQADAKQHPPEPAGSHRRLEEDASWADRWDMAS
jgi:hypothetical protein